MAGRDYRTLKLEILAETKQFVDDMKKGEKQVQTFGDRVKKFGDVAKAAFIAAAAAAAAYAGKLIVDGVKAAIEDEAAQKRLEVALRNVTNATNTQIAAVEKQITKMSLSYGIADDQLRPAFQRLATATGSLEKANEGLALALDISAATGKSVETVANALGKAYEGNTGALTRLGVGLSSAEVKALGLEGTMRQLSQTFGGAASQQAETFQGRINRLQVAFDEAKETIGFALLPILYRLLEFITNTAIPAFIDFKTRAIDPVIAAIKNNEATLRSLYEFGKDILVPFLKITLFSAIEGISTVARGIVEAVSFALRALEPIINAAIAGINAVIRAKNLLLGGNTPTIGQFNFGSTSGGVGLGSRPLGSTNIGGGFAGGGITSGGSGSGGTSGGAGRSGGGSGGTGTAAKAPSPYENLRGVPIIDALLELDNALKKTNRQLELGKISPYVAQQRLDEFMLARDTLVAQSQEYRQNVTINVNAPSAIDEQGFTRAVVDALNSVERRQAGGASALINL